MLPRCPRPPYGAQARSYLQTRLRVGSTVTLQPQTIDRYGRTVAEVIGEVNLNLALVEDGQAFVYRKYLGQCDAREYLEAEFRASRHRYGVWQVPGGITRPWDFRRGRTSTQTGEDTGSAPGGWRKRCHEIGSPKEVENLPRQDPTDLASNGENHHCENQP